MFFSVPVVSGWHDINWGKDTQSLGYTIDTVINEVLDNCHNYFTNGSGMIFKSMVSLDINISNVKPKDTAHSVDYKEQTYGHCNLIDKFEITQTARKGVIDVRELSNHCFIYSLAASLKHTDYETLEEKEDPSNYANFISENFNIGDLKFPIKHTDIQKICRHEPSLEYFNQRSHSYK